MTLKKQTKLVKQPLSISIAGFLIAVMDQTASMVNFTLRQPGLFELSIKYGNNHA